MFTRITIIIFLLLHQTLASAQTFEGGVVNNFSMNNAPDIPEIKKHNKWNDKWCVAHKTGIVTTCAGTILIVVGINANAHDPNRNKGFALSPGDADEILGAFLCIVGGGLTGGGAIYDHYHNRKHRVSLTFPNRNALGLVYHF